MKSTTMCHKFSLAWSFRNRFKELEKSVLTAHAHCPVAVDFVLVDAGSGSDVIAKVEGLRGSLGARTFRVCESAYRTSLSEAWNIGMMLTPARFVVFSSSDVVFEDGRWWDAISNALPEHPYTLLGNHAVFGLDKHKMIPGAGWFDEDFGIGAHFDCDYMIRASEAGIPVHVIKNDNYYVHDEENTSYIERVLDKDEDRLPIGNYDNERYFMRKWESTWPGWEMFKGTGTDLPHPPTNISICKRMLYEVDPHPRWTERIRRHASECR